VILRVMNGDLSVDYFVNTPTVSTQIKGTHNFHKIQSANN